MARQPSPVRRDTLLEAARAVFLADGYADASVRQIAVRAGLPATAVYTYFDDKDALLVAALARRLGTGHPVGLMLHHAAMDARDLKLLDALLGASARHPRARWVSMGNILCAHRPAVAAGPTDHRRQIS